MVDFPGVQQHLEATETAASFVAANIPGLASSTSNPELDQILARLAPLLSEISQAPVTTASVVSTTPHVSSGPQSVASMPNPAEALLEGLVTLAIDQFYVMMECCVELALSGGQSFAFLRPILDNYMENIKRVGGTERAKVYEA